MSTKVPKIFIVDDEPLLTEMLADFLQEHHPKAQIYSFPTGERCLEHLDDHPDLIILDFYLNSREKEAANGIDILKEIKQRNKALPVIMLSSQKSYGTAAQTIMYGAIHYVMKGQEAFAEIQQLVAANI